MGRRKRNDSLLDLLVELRWWVSVLVAGVVYAALRYWLPGYSIANPYLAMLAKAVESQAGFLGLILLIPAPLSMLRAFRRRRLLDQQTSLEPILAMSWRDFELLCGEAYRRQGFAVTENGGGGADGGIDLILKRNGERWLVQCKRWRDIKVSVKEIRELFGIVAAEGADRGVFITCSSYTQEARAFAEGNPIDLVDGPALLALVWGIQAAPVPKSPRPTLRVEPTFSPVRPAPTTATEPTCPRCGAVMMLRTARPGGNAGGQFWGCSAYPKCWGVVEAR